MEKAADRGIAEALRQVRSALEYHRGIGREVSLDPERLARFLRPGHGGGRDRAAAGRRTAAFQVMAAPATPDVPATLEEVRAEIGDCRRCKLWSGRTNIVFGAGNPGADLVFVGEGPGEDEDRMGEPFVGKAGQLLTRMIQAMGRTRDEVYIANIVKCRPPENRDPQPDEVTACEPFLVKQIKIIRPRVIAALGNWAAKTLLRTTTGITRLRGQFHDYQGIRVMPTFHPAYLLRNEADKRLAWDDLQKVMRELGWEAPR